MARLLGGLWQRIELIPKELLLLLLVLETITQQLRERVVCAQRGLCLLLRFQNVAEAGRHFHFASAIKQDLRAANVSMRDSLRVQML